jgi:hypothetical protein
MKRENYLVPVFSPFVLYLIWWEGEGISVIDRCRVSTYCTRNTHQYQSRGSNLVMNQLIPVRAHVSEPVLKNRFAHSPRATEPRPIVSIKYLYVDGPGSIRISAGFFSSQRPDRLWGLPSLLFNGYRGFFPRGQSDRSVKLTTHLHLVLRSRKVELNLHSAVNLHGISITT